MESVNTDRLHALNEEYGTEASAPNLVRDVALVVLDADHCELGRQVRIAQISALQFALQKPLDPSLPILALGRHDESPVSMCESS